MLTDVKLYKGFGDTSRMWNRNGVCLEWSFCGLKICNSIDGISISGNEKNFPLNAGIIVWEDLLPSNGEMSDYSVKKEDEIICHCRVFHCDEYDWLKNCTGDANTDIMQQTARCLETLYYRNRDLTSFDMDKFEKYYFPIGVNDNLRDEYLYLWKRRYWNKDADVLLNRDSDEQQIYDSCSSLNRGLEDELSLYFGI